MKENKKRSFKEGVKKVVPEPAQRLYYKQVKPRLPFLKTFAINSTAFYMFWWLLKKAGVDNEAALYVAYVFGYFVEISSMMRQKKLLDWVWLRWAIGAAIFLMARSVLFSVFEPEGLLQSVLSFIAGQIGYFCELGLLWLWLQLQNKRQ